MKTRTIKKDLIDIEVSQYDGPYSFLSLYKFSNLKIIEGIDIWVMKDVPAGQVTGLKVAAHLRPEYDNKKFEKDKKLHLDKMNHTHLFFKDLGKEKVYQQIHDFIEMLCTLESLSKGFFDFMLQIPILNKEFKPPVAFDSLSDKNNFEKKHYKF